jgi:lipoate-protein ligase B
MSTQTVHRTPVASPEWRFAPRITDWGTLSYDESHTRQLRALDERLHGTIPDSVFFVEHPHVYTYGRGFRGTLPAQPTFPVDPGESVSHVTVERGGDVTYHGPGQLVAYPIVDVRALTGDLHRFLHWLEDVLINTMAHWGIAGQHHPAHTGVWVGDRKIASIGVAVRQWISYHGVALNVTTDLRYFGAINPCGLPAEVMTSMVELTGSSIALHDVKAEFVAALRNTPSH